MSGNFFLSLGMALQKRHVGWIGSSPKRSAASHFEGIERQAEGPLYRDLASWFLGFMP